MIPAIMSLLEGGEERWNKAWKEKWRNNTEGEKMA